MRIEPLTKDKAEKILTETQGFYKKNYREFTIYSYRLADWKEFREHNAFELRGLTIDNETGLVFPSIHKFFNYKENPLTDYEFKETDEYEVMIKEDGSLIQPIVKPEKSQVIYKTKANFEAEQVQLVEEWNRKNDNKLSKFVLEMFNEYGYLPLFEIVSPKNQIVIEYKETNPILIQMRNMETFEYIPYEEMVKYAKKFGIPIVEVVEMSFKELIEKANTLEGLEGWVVRKVNPENYNDFMKVKTLWYLNLHKILSPNQLRVDYIIEQVLNETIDDVLAATEGEKKAYVEAIAYPFIDWFNKTVQEIVETIRENEELFKTSPKEVVKKVNQEIYFPIVMKYIRKENFTEEEIQKELKQFLKKKLNSYSKVKEFLKEEVGINV